MTNKYENGDVLKNIDDIYIVCGIDNIWHELVNLRNGEIWYKALQFEDMDNEINRGDFIYLGKAKDVLSIK